MADILIIDDDEMMVEIVSELLSDEGHAIRTASDGRQGLDSVAARAPDLIVLDMNMPVMNGYAVARSLRDQPAAHPLRILALTGDSAPAAVRAVHEAGCDALVTKPFDFDTLIASVRELLQSRRPAGNKPLVSAGPGAIPPPPGRHSPAPGS